MLDEQTKENRRIARAWKDAWGNRQFRNKAIIASIIFFCILLFMPIFFGVIEKREGPLLDDWLLNRIPARDVSIATFVVIWSMTLLLVTRAVQDPKIFIIFMCSLLISFLSRMISIMLFPLSPPLGLVPLIDPVTSFFYGGRHIFITRDLFYSGHTSIQFLIFLCLRKKADKILALGSSIAIASLVLVQHVHYTIDVLAAFPLTFLVYLWGRKIAAY